MFTFLHAADLHLDSPLRGLQRYEGAPVQAIRTASREALKRLVDLAIQERVRFVLIAGDVYDGDWPDTNTGLFFVNQMVRLKERGIPVFLIAGNHDAANRMTRSLPYPDNVFSFATDQPQTRKIEDLRVAIHGQSYADQAEKRNLAASYPASMSGWLNIGLLHTALDGREGHESYAPCELGHLIAHNYDYWALGHIHQRETVHATSPRIEFPGNLQGRHIRETGPKGCLLARVDNHGKVETEFRPVDVFRWAKVHVQCPMAEDRMAIEEAIADELSQVLETSDGLPLAVRIEITGPCPVHSNLLADQNGLADALRSRGLQLGSDRLWIEKIRIGTSSPEDVAPGLTLAEDALSELTKLVRELRTDPAMLGELLTDKELHDLEKKLPSNLRSGGEPLRLTDANWMSEMLDAVLPLLTYRPTAAERP